MSEVPENNKLRITREPFKTLALAALVLAVSAGAFELAARTEALSSRVRAPSYGTRIRFFDLQMERLQRYAEKGPIDCLFVGNSAVLQATDPEIFSDALAHRTGKRPRCFNFGLPGASARDVVPLSMILTRDFDVPLLIYPLTPRDVSKHALALRLEINRWVERRTVAFNLDGFLTESSHAFRYWLALQRDLGTGRAEPYVDFPIRDDGFFSAHRVRPGDDVITGGTHELLKQRGRYQNRWLSPIAYLPKRGTQVVLVELPATGLRSRSMETDPDDAAHGFANRIAPLAEQEGVHLIRAPQERLIPEDGWADFVHMNARGAAHFSRWLAERVADANAAGDLDLAFEVRGR